MQKLSVPNQVIELLQQINTGRITPAHIQVLLEKPNEVAALSDSKRIKKTDGPGYIVVQDDRRLMKVFPDGSVETVVSGSVKGFAYEVEEDVDLGKGRVAFRVHLGGVRYIVFDGKLYPFDHTGDVDKEAASEGRLFIRPWHGTRNDTGRIFLDGIDYGFGSKPCLINGKLFFRNHDKDNRETLKGHYAFFDGVKYGPYSEAPENHSCNGQFVLEGSRDGSVFVNVDGKEYGPYGYLEPVSRQDGLINPRTVGFAPSLAQQKVVVIDSKIFFKATGGTFYEEKGPHRRSVRDSTILFFDGAEYGPYQNVDDIRVVNGRLRYHAWDGPEVPGFGDRKSYENGIAL